MYEKVWRYHTMATDSTNKLAAKEPYVTEFEASVRSVNGRGVRLDQTYFYPEGGGQPADSGTLDGIDVIDVQKRDGVIIHTLETEPGFEADEAVTGRIDEEFRTYCMRAHTASHLVYGAGRRLFVDPGYGGFDIGLEKVRLDFKTDLDPDDVNAITFERMVNEVVWDSRDITWDEMDSERARQRDDVIFNLTDNSEQSDTVRVVEIDEWDIAACGGTHVQNTNEAGPIAVLDVSNPGSDLVRVEYAVGPTAIQTRIDERKNAKRAADAMDTSVEDLSECATSLVQEKASLKEEIDQLHERLLEEHIETLAEEAVSKNGDDWIVGEVEGMGPNDVSERVRNLAGDAGDVIALTGVNGDSFLVVATTGEPDASEVVDDVTAEFDGGGGGGSTFAQGGGLDEEPATVVEYLREQP
ncbi:alanine--tRNA ligase-related protein [Halostagnicola sp. A-GB9-2]|uniref:alanyl-tRNA editing protein n=1 Tax=Halostagnicola sp. A-GB9-2 TaxID=3048066 RepID=UPI0024BFBFFE|nr:alanine--tRNA ligase-related protein [Halostagnicola sp. A-GB9-2]MDJ1433764.1 alanine--tRNA ligase-related protein [Halostagnicola sp. A-GB9-2]